MNSPADVQIVHCSSSSESDRLMQTAFQKQGGRNSASRSHSNGSCIIRSILAVNPVNLLGSIEIHLELMTAAAR